MDTPIRTKTPSLQYCTTKDLVKIDHFPLLCPLHFDVLTKMKVSFKSICLKTATRAFSLLVTENENFASFQT